MKGRLFIGADELRIESFRLASKIPFCPDFVVALWRGGATVGCYVHEMLMRRYPGKVIDPISIRTSRYTGIDKAKDTVQVDGIDYVFRNMHLGARVLVVDDVWDAGTTMSAVKDILCKLNVTTHVAVLYFKPTRNKFPLDKPDFYLHETDQWLQFPHELEGLSDEDIIKHHGEETLQLIRYNQSD